MLNTLFQKYWILAVLAFSSTTGVRSQFPVSVDVVYDFIKSNSIHRQKVDWGAMDQEFWTAVSSARNLNDTMEAFVLVLKALDDVHSQLYLNNQYYGYWHPTEESNSPTLTNLVENARATIGIIKDTLLEEKYAYVRVPGIKANGFAEVNVYARAIRDTIDYYGRKDVKGFVLDLRLNMGGNMYPMLSGLGCLLGDGEIAYEVDLTDTIVRTWHIEQGNFVLNDFPVTNLEQASIKGLNEIPVVVLIGPVTASSGSTTAIAFKGRRNVILIGEPTAKGYTTSNGYFQFAPDFYMNFAVAYVADRNMRLYPSEVEPDVIIPGGDNFEKLMLDEKIKRALLWLKANTK
jgi:C-terminal processing protease CtpA/Prc